ncbi:MAG: complex I NDUFA9 subunit family protein [Alphaproteobacteria bacterium]|nr:complex I NDUFA9 subunit family protein [Alphaproteobacteria bacterium]
MTFRRVTVFGGSGFLGRHIVQRLAQTGAVVRVGVRRVEDAHVLQPQGDVGQIVGVRADVRDPASLTRAAEGAEAVINLVGILYESGKATFRAIHAEGAANVARVAADVGARRFVHVSALGADPHSPAEYARSKAAGEAAVFEAFPDATVLRPSVVFGPEDDFFNRFAALARISPMLPVFGCPLPRLVSDAGGVRIDLYGDGGTKFQPAYVGDVADAAMAALTRPDAKGQIYELGGPTVYSFKALMDLVLQATARRRFVAPLPFWLGMVQGFFFELLPGPPVLTRDQVRLLRRDNVVDPDAKGFAALGISPKAAEAILPTYMDRHRRGGRYRSRFA